MNLIIWIGTGLIAGAVAHRVLNSRGGFFGSLIVGLIGALVGGQISSILQLNVTGAFLDQLIVATLGAILFLFLWRKLRN